MSNKPKYLEMTLPLSNNSVKWCNRVFCSWGQRKSTHDKEGKLKGIFIITPIGGMTPLWENPSPLFFKILFILELIGSLIFIASYVAIQHYNIILLNSGTLVTSDPQVAIDQANNKTCVSVSYSYLKSFFIIIGSIILLINSLYYLFLACISYASDKEWSRYLCIHAILWIALVGFLIGHFITVSQNLAFYQNNTLGIFGKSGTDSCQQIFLANLWLNLVVAILVSILAVLQILKIFQIGKKFFMVSYVPHSAICTDDDIVVFYN